MAATDGDRAIRDLHSLLEDTQWHRAEDNARGQFGHLRLLLDHAGATVPFYRDRLTGLGGGQPLDADVWRRIPVMRRADIQDAGDDLRCEKLPAAHGGTTKVRSSGSTGTPVTVIDTDHNHLFLRAFQLRFHVWFGRDFSHTMAHISRLTGANVERAGRGEPVQWVPGHASGPCYYFDIARPAREQLDWLNRIKPQVLVTYPSNLAHLISQSRELSIGLPFLSEVCTMSEVLAAETRDDCEQAWGVKVSDTYSAQEAGIIALQCPQSGLYHVMSEGVLVEVLDDADQPCAAGRVGRVVVTALHNFAMPLIRYEIGDYAEAGPPCPCGRGLPTLKRVLGRVRNMLVRPDGEKIWPSFGSRGLTDIAPIRQHQIVQTKRDHLEARLVTDRPLSNDEEARLGAHILTRFPDGLSVSFVYPDAIGRGPGGKFEDFTSEVDAG